MDDWRRARLVAEVNLHALKLSHVLDAGGQLEREQAHSLLHSMVRLTEAFRVVVPERPGLMVAEAEETLRRALGALD